MNIILTKLELENFGMFRDKVTFNFHSNGIHRINGRDVVDPFKNNGIGKSQLFMSIAWILFGATSKKKKADSIINKETKKNLFGILTFIVDDKEYRIERYRKHSKHKNNLYVFENQEEISLAETSLTQELIDKLIKINEDIYMKTSLLSVEESKSFFELSKNDKNDLLESVIKIDFDKFEKTLSKKVTLFNKAQKENDTLLTKSEHTINEYIKLKHNLIKNYKRKRSEKEKDSTLSKERKDDINKFLKYEDILRTKKRSLDRIEYDLQQINRTRKNCHEEYKEINRKINKCISNVTTCPSCSYSWHDEKTLERLKDNKSFIVKEIIDLAPRKLKQKSVYRERKLLIDKLANAIETLNVSAEEIQEFNNSSIKQNIERDVLKKETKENYNLYSLKIEEETKILTKLKNIEKSLEKEEDIISFWVEAFNYKSEEGIKSFIRNRFIPTFNTVLGNIVDIIYENTMNILFDSSFEESIIYRGESYLYSDLSRGEKAKLNLCISFALLEIVRFNMIKTNVLFLDEIFSGIDFSTIEKFIQIIKNTYAKNTGVYIISHERGIDEALVDCLSSTIEIVKESEFSSKIFM